MEQVWDPLRKKLVALTPEEKVRQWFIGVLRDSAQVPAHMMMSEVALRFGDKPYRADILVYGRDTAPLMVVECKREDVQLDREVLEQALRYNLALGVKYIIITNGRKTFGFKRVETAGQTGHENEAPFEQMNSFPTWEEMRK
ncbi:MAG: type I restriction enzyme HsdR N-terminal domain-containing protein [Bacteroidales bacterium]|nr:type I restriction enzyme HsdR N-terminal domain-containing protein [Bacteroidales bacterium]